MPQIRISSDLLGALARQCQTVSDDFQSLHARTLNNLKDVQLASQECDLDSVLKDLQTCHHRLANQFKQTVQNLNRISSGVEDFQKETNKAQSQLRDQIHQLNSTMKISYASLGGLPISLTDPGSTPQKQAALGAASPAGGEPLAVSRVRPSEQGGDTPGFSDYVVRPGDSLSTIADRHGLSLQAVVSSNPQIHDPNLIVPGQTIQVEGSHLQEVQPPLEPVNREFHGTDPLNHATIEPQAQHMGASCGQTSVAMSIESLTGKPTNDYDINDKYGFGLLDALNSECQPCGYTWSDGGNVGADSWDLIEQKVNHEGSPVIVALNGPEFSVSGRGHIVTITKVEGNCVYFADPASGTIRTTTKESMNNAPSHPDGNFIFYPSRSA